MKVLILRFSSIGDIVLTSPVMRCLKTQRPDIEIHYATKKQFRSLLAFNPYIDKLHLLGDSTTELINQLRKEKFDLIIDLHNNLRTANIRSRLGVKRHKVDKLNWEKWLMVTFKLNLLPYAHIVDRYMETVVQLNVINDALGLDHFTDPEANLNGFILPESFSVYAIGGQHNTKKLPFIKQKELVNAIKGPVVLIGGKEDAEDGQALANTSTDCLNLCGQLSIDQSTLLMKGATRVYTHDTGMMHIAAALKKPITSIWGNTLPEFGMTPYYPDDFDYSLSVTKEVKHLSCRPCSKLGYEKCPRGHFKCMMDQDFSDLQ